MRKVEKVLELQDKLNSFINPEWKNERTPLDWLIAIKDEHSELLNSLKWKWWKDFNEFDIVKLQTEFEQDFIKLIQEIYKEFSKYVKDFELDKDLDEIILKNNLTKEKIYIFINDRTKLKKDEIENLETIGIVITTILDNLNESVIKEFKEKYLSKIQDLLIKDKENIKLELIDILHFVISLYLQVVQKFNIDKKIQDKLINILETEDLPKNEFTIKENFLMTIDNIIVGTLLLKLIDTQKNVKECFKDIKRFFVFYNLRNTRYEFFKRITSLQNTTENIIEEIDNIYKLQRLFDYMNTQLNDVIEKQELNENEIKDNIVSLLSALFVDYRKLVDEFGFSINEILDEYIYKNHLNILRQKYGYKKGTYKKEIKITENTLNKIEDEKIKETLKEKCLNRICEDNEIIRIIIDTLKGQNIKDLETQLQKIEEIIQILNRD